MTTTERKQLLFQRLLAIDDEQLLEDVENLLDKHGQDRILYFSSELRGKVDNAIEQMNQGKVVTTAEMERRMERWSGK